MGGNYAVLGATGNCGTALIRILLDHQPPPQIRAYCRNKGKLQRLIPELSEASTASVQIFEGSIDDIALLASCIRDCSAVFLVVSASTNVPGLRTSQDTAHGVIRALELLRSDGGELDHGHTDRPATSRPAIPKLVLLSSAALDDHFSRQIPTLLHWILLRAASNVYHDLREAERFLRVQQDWVSTIFVKPGALSVDRRRGHALSFTEESGPISFLDLAAAMIEAADDPDGRYDNRNVSVVHTGGRAKFPIGTPLAILIGLLLHYFPALYPYMPST